MSKCALFDEERLQVPWPFPQAGIPMIPRDFMPGLWKSTVSHALLMYHIRADGIRRTTSTCRGVVSLAYKEGSNSFRPPSVCAATTLLIDDRGISVEGPLHKV